MIAWLAYLVRMFAAVVMLVTAAALLLAASTDKTNGRTFSLATAAVFGLAGFFAWPKRPNAWRREPPTDRQISFARDLGITIPRGVSKGELSDMISQAKALRDAL